GPALFSRRNNGRPARRGEPSLGFGRLGRRSPLALRTGIRPTLPLGLRYPRASSRTDLAPCLAGSGAAGLPWRLIPQSLAYLCHPRLDMVDLMLAADQGGLQGLGVNSCHV